jgi:hypothetical protein
MALWRREFLSLGLTLAALGGGGASAAPANGPQAKGEPLDAWLDEGGRRHRIIFDTTSTRGAGEALMFADNFYKANLSGYGIPAKDLSVIIILRHSSAVFGFNDAAWGKYGSFLSDWGNLGELGFKSPATVNLYDASPLDPRLFSNGRKLSGLTQQGVRFAVCEVASRYVASMVSKATGADTNAVMEDMKANLIPAAVMVPAGIVTLNRAQERGYSVSCSG